MSSNDYLMHNNRPCAFRALSPFHPVAEDGLLVACLSVRLSSSHCIGAHRCLPNHRFLEPHHNSRPRWPSNFPTHGQWYFLPVRPRGCDVTSPVSGRNKSTSTGLSDGVVERSPLLLLASLRGESPSRRLECFRRMTVASSSPVVG